MPPDLIKRPRFSSRTIARTSNCISVQYHNNLHTEVSRRMNESQKIDVDLLCNSTNGDFNLVSRLANIVNDYYPQQLEQIKTAIENGDDESLSSKTRHLVGVLNDMGAISAAKQGLTLEASSADSEFANRYADELETEIIFALEEIRTICDLRTAINGRNPLKTG